jgi:hypothetical protein
MWIHVAGWAPRLLGEPAEVLRRETDFRKGFRFSLPSLSCEQHTTLSCPLVDEFGGASQHVSAYAGRRVRPTLEGVSGGVGGRPRVCGRAIPDRTGARPVGGVQNLLAARRVVPLAGDEGGGARGRIIARSWVSSRRRRSSAFVVEAPGYIPGGHGVAYIRYQIDCQLCRRRAGNSQGRQGWDAPAERVNM